MKDYLKEINEKFPIRRKREQKQAFFEYLENEFEKGEVRKEKKQKNDNIVIGDFENAEVIFTAHYDTPASSLLPNLMMPRNKGLALLYGFGYPFILALLSLAVAFLIETIAKLEYIHTLIIYLIIYFGAFYLCTRCFTNKNNANDNTSGVATVISIAKRSRNPKIAFILFDNEEKGLEGSKAFKKQYKEKLKDKLVINFDCVANGSEILFIAKKGAREHRLYRTVEQVFQSNERFNLHYFPMESSFGNSDQKNFDCGVLVTAATKAKRIKFYTGKIHTNKDVIASSENVYYLTEKAVEFLEKI